MTGHEIPNRQWPMVGSDLFEFNSLKCYMTFVSVNQKKMRYHQSVKSSRNRSHNSVQISKGKLANVVKIF